MNNKVVDEIKVFVREELQKEIDDLKNDIQQFRDLEVEYHQRLEQAKEIMRKQWDLELDEVTIKTQQFIMEQMSTPPKVVSITTPHNTIHQMIMALWRGDTNKAKYFLHLYLQDEMKEMSEEK